MFTKIDFFCWQRYLDWPEIEIWSDHSSRIVLIGEASRPLIVSPFTALVIYALTRLSSFVVYRAVACP